MVESNPANKTRIEVLWCNLNNQRISQGRKKYFGRRLVDRRSNPKDDCRRLDVRSDMTKLSHLGSRRNSWRSCSRTKQIVRLWAEANLAMSMAVLSTGYARISPLDITAFAELAMGALENKVSSMSP